MNTHQCSSFCFFFFLHPSYGAHFLWWFTVGSIVIVVKMDVFFWLKIGTTKMYRGSFTNFVRWSCEIFFFFLFRNIRFCLLKWWSMRTTINLFLNYRAHGVRGVKAIPSPSATAAVAAALSSSVPSSLVIGNIIIVVIINLIILVIVINWYRGGGWGGVVKKKSKKLFLLISIISSGWLSVLYIRWVALSVLKVLKKEKIVFFFLIFNFIIIIYVHFVKFGSPKTKTKLPHNTELRKKSRKL